VATFRRRDAKRTWHTGWSCPQTGLFICKRSREGRSGRGSSRDEFDFIAPEAHMVITSARTSGLNLLRLVETLKEARRHPFRWDLPLADLALTQLDEVFLAGKEAAEQRLTFVAKRALRKAREVALLARVEEARKANDAAYAAAIDSNLHHLDDSARCSRVRDAFRTTTSALRRALDELDAFKASPE